MDKWGQIRPKDVHLEGEEVSTEGRGGVRLNAGCTSRWDGLLPTQVQSLTEGAQSLQNGQLQLEGQRVGINWSSPGTDGGLRG